MDIVDKILLELVKGGIHEDYHCEGMGKSIEKDFDWSAFLQQAYNQVVMGISWDGLIKSGYTELPRDAKLKWYSDVINAYENRYRQYESNIFHLADFYKSHGIDMLILKGYGLSRNYPNPLHRPCGDIDIYLFDKHKVADGLIEQEKGIKVDRDHLLHTIFFFKGESVENHYGFVEEEVHRFNEQIVRILNEEINRDNEQIEICHHRSGDEEKKISLLIPSPKFNSIYLLHHTAKHFASEQVMIRHLLDWATFVRKYNDQIDWDYLFEVTDKSYLTLFLNCLNFLCVRYLAFKEDEFPIRWNSNYKSCSSKELERYADRVFKEILHPQYSIVKPNGFLKNKLFRIGRWLSYSWKRKLVYNEGFIESLYRRIDV